MSIGLALVSIALTASALAIRLLTADLVDDSFVVQLAVGVLSSPSAAWPWCMLVISSSIIQAIKCPAHSKSEFVKSPFGFFHDTSRF